jgi:hypothetical protein
MDLTLTNKQADRQNERDFLLIEIESFIDGQLDKVLRKAYYRL